MPTIVTSNAGHILSLIYLEIEKMQGIFSTEDTGQGPILTTNWKVLRSAETAYSFG
jgi:hypothetical protein